MHYPYESPAVGSLGLLVLLYYTVAVVGVLAFWKLVVGSQ
jgi:hypothetical protein